MKLSQQEIFDKAVTALLAQGERAWNSAHGMCQYAGHSGLRCAVGQLIPDHLLEYASVVWGGVADLRSALMEYDHDFARFLDSNDEFLTALQNIHDNPWSIGCEHSDWLGHFIAKAREFAKNHGLSPAVLDDFEIGATA